MAEGTLGAGLQDHRGLQQRQRPGDPREVPAVYCGVSTTEFFEHAVATIDGSKVRAVNAPDKNFTRAKLQKRMDQVEASIERYMAALETADRQEGDVARAKSA